MADRLGDHCLAYLVGQLLLIDQPQEHQGAAGRVDQPSRAVPANLLGKFLGSQHLAQRANILHVDQAVERGA